VQGHEFDSTIVAGALALDAAEVEERLAELERVHAVVRCLREHELPDGAPSLLYGFVHALFQNAFYESLQPTRRASLSLAVADALLAHYGAPIVATEAGFLLETAREHSRAAEMFRLAAEAAFRASASTECVALARRGLALVPKVPDPNARPPLELGLLTMLGVALRSMRGFTDPEVEATYHRAIAVCREIGKSVELMPVLWGLALHYLMRGEVEMNAQIVDQMSAIAEREGTPVLLVQAHVHRGVTLLQAGSPVRALKELREVVSLYDPDKKEQYTVQFGGDPMPMIGSFLAWGQWLTGDAAGAAETVTDIVRRARVGPSMTSAHGLFFSAFVSQLARKPEDARRYAEEALQMSRAHDFGFYATMAEMWRAWAIAAQGDLDEGIEGMMRGLASARATGTQSCQAHVLAMLAETLADAGRLDEALEAVVEASALVERTGERYYEAEIDRVEGGDIARSCG
jgi:predicted ATPase